MSDYEFFFQMLLNIGCMLIILIGIIVYFACNFYFLIKKLSYKIARINEELDRLQSGEDHES